MQRYIVVLPIIAMVGACSGGTPENARIQEYESRVSKLEARLEKLESQLKAIESSATRLAELTTGQGQAIAATKSGLKMKEDDLRKREQALAKATEAVRATSFGDGTWEVGRDIQPGKYRTDNASGSCYWEKNIGGEGIHSILGNDNAVGPTTVVISPKVPFFTEFSVR